VLIVTVLAGPGPPGREVPAGPSPGLRAEPGDILVIDSAGIAAAARVGTIISVGSADGSPPYLVYWQAGDYQSRIRPGPGARIRKRSGPVAAQP
jgi:hypothetical protein